MLSNTSDINSVQKCVSSSMQHNSEHVTGPCMKPRLKIFCQPPKPTSIFAGIASDHRETIWNMLLLASLTAKILVKVKQTSYNLKTTWDGHVQEACSVAFPTYCLKWPRVVRAVATCQRSFIVSSNRVLNWLRVMLSSLNFSGRMFHMCEARTKNEFWKVVLLHLWGRKLM